MWTRLPLFLSHPLPLAIAHRGGAHSHPENTMVAFEYAVSLGYRVLETDVHVTQDGKLVAFHDDELDRVTDRHGIIAQLPWEEIKRARVDGREPIPLLEELLAAWPDVHVNIDPKHDAAVEPLLETLRRTGSEQRICVGSFSGERLRRIRERAPDVLTSTGPMEVARLRVASVGIPVGSIAASLVQVPWSHKGIPIVDRAFIRAAHRRSLPVHVWTVNDVDEMHRLLDLGVDGIMTDDLHALKAVYRERGVWREE
ncbi:MAG: glycerophosphodiester phosphodiesterase [Pseudomonadota bacterium]